MGARGRRPRGAGYQPQDDVRVMTDPGRPRVLPVRGRASGLMPAWVQHVEVPRREPVVRPLLVEEDAEAVQGRALLLRREARLMPCVGTGRRSSSSSRREEVVTDLLAVVRSGRRARHRAMAAGPAGTSRPRGFRGHERRRAGPAGGTAMASPSTARPTRHRPTNSRWRRFSTVDQLVGDPRVPNLLGQSPHARPVSAPRSRRRRRARPGRRPRQSAAGRPARDGDGPARPRPAVPRRRR